MDTNAGILLSSLITQLPQIGIATAGLILIQSRLKHAHPRAYLHGIIGFSLLLLNGLWGGLSRAWLSMQLMQSVDRMAATSKLAVANLGGFVMLIAALALILAAVLADRDTSTSSEGRVPVA